MKQALTSLPAKLQSLKEDVSRVETLLQGEQQQLEEAQQYRAELEGTIRENQDLLNKAKAKLSQVRTSKEYMANQRELETTRKSTQEREDELLKLMEAIEASEKSIAAHKEDLAGLQEHVAAEDAETRDKISEIEARLGGRQAKRDEMAASIRRDVLIYYNKIKVRRGNAVVPARNGVCSGCNMQLSPQLFNILQRGNSVEHCPSCYRIVYFDPEKDK